MRASETLFREPWTPRPLAARSRSAFGNTTVGIIDPNKRKVGVYRPDSRLLTLDDERDRDAALAALRALGHEPLAPVPGTLGDLRYEHAPVVITFRSGELWIRYAADGPPENLLEVGIYRPDGGELAISSDLYVPMLTAVLNRMRVEPVTVIWEEPHFDWAKWDETGPLYPGTSYEDSGRTSLIRTRRHSQTLSPRTPKRALPTRA